MIIKYVLGGLLALSLLFNTIQSCQRTSLKNQLSRCKQEVHLQTELYEDGLVLIDSLTNITRSQIIPPKPVEKKRTTLKSVSKIETVSTIETKVPTIVPPLPTPIEVTPIVYPTYQASYEDQWVSINSISGKDSTSYSLKVRDYLTHTHVFKKPFLKKNYFEVWTRSSNPYTTIENVSSYIVKEPAYWMISPSIHIGYNHLLQPNVSIGLSLSRSNISLKIK